MPNPHLDYGVPLTISTPTTPPVSTGTPNFGPPGTGGNNQPPPPQVTTPISTGTPNFGGQGTGGANQPPPTPIIDVAAEQDAIDDALAISLANQNNQDTYTPHEEIYGPGQAIPGVTGYASTNVDPNSAIWESLQTMDPDTLAFFGYTPGSTTVPNELMSMVAEGSFVSGNEAVETDEPYTTTWSQFEDMSQLAAAGNEYAQQWLAENTLFPGGLDDYYDVMGNPNVINIHHGEGGGQQFFETDYYDPRQETFDKLRFLQAGLPQRGMEQSGFFGEMTDPYSADVSEALNKGIFSGAMRQGVFDPKGLRRLITSFGSGVTKPRYANIARGGIVSLVGE